MAKAIGAFERKLLTPPRWDNYLKGDKGALTSEEQAVRDMGEYQLGRTLTADETKQIVDFLKVLTGTIDPEFTRPPVLPKSTAATPKPDER